MENTGCSLGLVARELVPGVDGGDRVAAAELPGQPEAVDGVDDGPRVDDRLQGGVLHRPAEGPDVLAFQEERPFLLVIKGVAEVDVHLAGVGLDLAEVGIVGAVQGQVGGQADTCRSG